LRKFDQAFIKVIVLFLNNTADIFSIPFEITHSTQEIEIPSANQTDTAAGGSGRAEENSLCMMPYRKSRLKTSIYPPFAEKIISHLQEER
jgi:hypothetical protein